MSHGTVNLQWARRIFPNAPTDELGLAAGSFGILDSRHQCHWLAQLAHESGRFRSTRESLNYSVEGLLKTFRRHRITRAQAELYGRIPGRKADQEAIANILYGGAWGAKNLGNTMPGDGAKFIGRGYKQLTGRENYRAFSLGTFGDNQILYHPERLEEPHCAALSAAWFWANNNLHRLADTYDVRHITERVTGWKGSGSGMNVGYPKRQAWFDRLMDVRHDD